MNHWKNRPSRLTVNAITRPVSLLVISKPSTLTRRTVSLSLKLGPPPTTLTERSNSRTTLPVSLNWNAHVLIQMLIPISRAVEGLKLELLTSLLPSVNEKAAKINATYKKPNVHTVATLDVFKVSFSVLARSCRMDWIWPTLSWIDQLQCQLCLWSTRFPRWCRSCLQRFGWQGSVYIYPMEEKHVNS